MRFVFPTKKQSIFWREAVSQPPLKHCKIFQIPSASSEITVCNSGIFSVELSPTVIFIPGTCIIQINSYAMQTCIATSFIIKAIQNSNWDVGHGYDSTVGDFFFVVFSSWCLLLRRPLIFLFLSLFFLSFSTVNLFASDTVEVVEYVFHFGDRRLRSVWFRITCFRYVSENIHASSFMILEIEIVVIWYGRYDSSEVSRFFWSSILSPSLSVPFFQIMFLAGFLVLVKVPWPRLDMAIQWRTPYLIVVLYYPAFIGMP